MIPEDENDEATSANCAKWKILPRYWEANKFTTIGEKLRTIENYNKKNLDVKHQKS